MTVPPPPLAELGWIPTRAGHAFGALYLPRAGAPVGARALLACPSFGCERMMLHVAYRRLGELAALRGIPTLVVDYPGTADAAGYPRDSAQLRRALDSLQDAADWLRARCGLPSLAGFGFGFGATLASMLAGEREDLTALALHAPALSGRRWLREQTAATTLVPGHGPRPTSYREGDLDLMGFVLHQDSVQEIRPLDLLTAAPPSHLRHALIAPRSSSTPEPRWAESLRAAGVEVTLEREPPVNVEQELFVLGARAPEGFLRRVTQWLATLPTPSSARPLAIPGGPGLLRDVVLPAQDGTPIRERTLRFGPGNGLCAVASEPRDPSNPARHAIVMINGGYNHRPGINRNYAEWARRWAARGARVLRIDYGGLGDAAPLTDSPLDDSLDPQTQGLYVHRTRDDVVASLDLAESLWGAGSMTLLGLCAGAFESMRAASADSRVRGLMLINPVRLDPEPPLHFLLLALRSRERWEQDYRDAPLHLVRDVRDALLQGSRKVLEKAGAHGPYESAAGKRLLDLCARGVQTLVIMDDQEYLLDAMRRLVRAVQETPEGARRLDLQVLAGGNHIMSPLPLQEQVTWTLDAYVEQYVLDATQGRAPKGPLPASPLESWRPEP